MASRAEAEADPGWPELVEFLSVAGLKDDPLERMLAQLAANDVTNLVMLRCSFSALAKALATDLKAGTRAKISNALAANSSVGGPQQQPAGPPSQVLFNVTISFKQQQATVLLALPVSRITARSR